MDKLRPHIEKKFKIAGSLAWYLNIFSIIIGLFYPLFLILFAFSMIGITLLHNSENGSPGGNFIFFLAESIPYIYFITTILGISLTTIYAYSNKSLADKNIRHLKIIAAISLLLLLLYFVFNIFNWA